MVKSIVLLILVIILMTFSYKLLGQGAFIGVFLFLCANNIGKYVGDKK